MGWLADYDFRVTIPVKNNTASVLTNYPIKITLVKGTGTNTAGTIYLQNHSLDWPTDIRFTDSDESSLLHFWREESDSTDGTWWVEVSLTASQTKNIYLYYGKTGETDLSSATDVFSLYDDFSDNSIDGSKWTTSGTVNESGTAITAVGNPAYIRSIATFGLNYAVCIKMHSADDGDAAHKQCMMMCFKDSSNNYVRWLTNEGSLPEKLWTQIITAGTSKSLVDRDINDVLNYHVLEIRRYTSSHNDFVHDSTVYHDTTAGAPTGSLYVEIYAWYNDTTTVDYIYVRQIIESEPSWETPATSESTPPMVSNSLKIVYYLSQPPEEKNYSSPSVLTRFSVSQANYYNGSQSIKIATSQYIRGVNPSTDVTVFPTSLHRNFSRIADFEDEWLGYCPENWFSGSAIDASASDGWLGYSVSEADLSEYNILSLQIESQNTVAFDIVFIDTAGNKSPTFSTQTTSEFWRRTEVPITWGDCNSQAIDVIRFYPRGEANSLVYIDDIILVDCRPESEKSEWIEMSIQSMNYNRDASTNYTRVAGHFGDSIYSTNPNRRRGEVGFRTHAPQDDDDLLFVELATKNARQLYFRFLTEGYVIHLTENSADIKDSIYGPQKIISFNFIEGK